jgi:hypothetical protein
MLRHALVIVLVLSAACKNAPPKGDLPPAPAPAASEGSSSSTPCTPPAPSGNPHASVPHQTAPTSLDDLAAGRLGLGPFSLVAPKGWTARPVTSNMRAADFVLPAAKPGDDAELVVYYFGDHGAGSVDDNLDRWLGQFEQADGKKPRDVAKIEKSKFAGQDATVVSIDGHFKAQAMAGATEAVDKPNQALLAAIIDSPSGPYYFKLIGAKATVDAQAAAFRAMLGSLTLR